MSPAAWAFIYLGAGIFAITMLAIVLDETDNGDVFEDPLTAGVLTLIWPLTVCVVVVVGAIYGFGKLVMWVVRR